VLTLIRAHALLHQALRQRDNRGRLVAEIADYAAIRDLVADLVAEGVGATVKPQTREVVDTVKTLLAAGRDEVRQVDVKAALLLDKSSISRRIADAIDAGFLRNMEDRKGRPARLVIGDPMPDDVEVLPTPDRLAGAIAGLHGCAVDEVD
jgi:hypothetical protein